MIEGERERESIRQAVFGVLPWNTELSAEWAAALIATGLELAVGAAVRVFGRKDAPKQLSKMINQLLEKHK